MPPSNPFLTGKPTTSMTTTPPSSLSRETAARGPSYLCISSTRPVPASSHARAPSCPPKAMARVPQKYQSTRRPSLPGSGYGIKNTRITGGKATNTSFNTTLPTIPEIAVPKAPMLLEDFDKVHATLKNLTKLCQESSNVTESVVLPLLDFLPMQTFQEQLLAGLDFSSMEASPGQQAKETMTQLSNHLTKSLLKSSEAHRLAMVIELGMYFLRGKLSHESQFRSQVDTTKTQEELVLARKRILELEDVVADQAVEIKRERNEKAQMVREMEELVREMEGMKGIFGRLRERIGTGHGQSGAGGSGSGPSRGEGLMKREEKGKGAGRG